MSGQTLHQDYYPPSLIQVGLHYALVELPAVLTGRCDMPTSIFEMMSRELNNNNIFI